MTKCPVCGGQMKAMKNITIYGGTVTLGHKCKRCGYWTGKTRRVPSRYIFTLRRTGATNKEPSTVIGSEPE